MVGCGIMVGSLYWEGAWGSTNFVTLWAVVLLVFVVGILVLIFFGGKTKMRNEREVIRENMRKTNDNKKL